MEIWIVISAVLAAALLALICRLHGIRSALKDITGQLHTKLNEATNISISTASNDKAVCGLAADLNRELRVLRREQLRLENGNHELQTAVTNIAHDLRTPLTAISGYLELLEREELEEAPARYLSVIRERTEALKDLTEELFRYSVADTNVEELETERLSLNRELEVALAGSYQLLSENNIIPVIRIPEETVERELNRKALQRIFGNVLSNAAKYSSGDLSVILRPDGTVVFSNSAPGLSEIEVGKLFDRFYTVENAKNSTGLGLSIAKLLTEKMGGSIDAGLENNTLSILIRF